ncbi:carboxypeptidase-like regulatory domain-containing protein [candidate division KSB1 bacterium]
MLRQCGSIELYAPFVCLFSYPAGFFIHYGNKGAKIRTLIYIFSLLVFTILSVPPYAECQVVSNSSTITGTITESTTGDPLQGANVYIAQSLMGAAADAQGRYTIYNVPPGTYQVVASFIGYKIGKTQIHIDKNSEYYIDFKLEPDALEFEEIVVTSDRIEEWKRHFDRFKREFFGTTENADDCTILNPDILYFDDDRVNREFTATARDLLKIENRALGYIVALYLEEFSIISSIVRIRIIPRFSEMTPGSGEQREQWIEAREKSYSGSLRHFLAVLVRGTLREEAFEVRHARWIDGKYRYDQDFTLEQILSRGRTDHERILHFKDLLRVDFRNKETSYVELRDEQVFFNVLGTLPVPFTILTYGAMAEKRIADILPIEYSIQQNPEDKD